MTRVLAIVGTKGPFPRLVDALADVARETGWDVRVQHASDALPAGLTGWAELPRAALLEELEAADAVVCHAGSGTIRDALRAGHRPIVVPRLGRHGEHVNDHQLELVAALSGRITPIADLAGRELAQALKTAIEGAAKVPPAVLPGDALRAALGAEIEAIAARPASRRARFIYGVLGAVLGRASPRASR